ncbi:MAG: thioredoxin family protein [Pseudomonadota bacterium]|nr:thioredoxin family protein [Pseudomonadota bacterium]
MYADQEPTCAEVDALAGVTLLEFGAPWCPHCSGAQPALEAVLAGQTDVRHIKIKDGRGRRLGRSFRVKMWPTLVLLCDGKEIARRVRPTGRGEVEQAMALLDRDALDPRAPD